MALSGSNGYQMKVCKAVLFLFFTLITHLSALSQLPKDFECVIGTDTTIFSKIHIYIFSHPGCGYCWRAFKDLGQWAKDNPVTLIAMDVSGQVDKIKANEKIFATYKEYKIQLFDASFCEKKYRLFIPKIYFFKTETTELIFKMKGWGKGDIHRVQKTLRKYI